MDRSIRHPMLVAIVFAMIGGGSGAAAAEDRVSFNRDIRPILSDRCYYCHGFDENHRQADLRLDIREEAEWVYDTGSPRDSELIARITSDDADIVMPPPEAHKKAITADEVALIERWIAQGAEYEPHWAFVNPVRPETDASTTAAAIDDFVGRRHGQHGLSFAPEAEPRKWLRRAALDLTGLPPSTQQMDAFAAAVKTDGEAAYDAAADRLLASPGYGERMALEWLDVARYADTNGFQMDAYRMNWPWRDWAVAAFNDNMPFDRFTIEQLAGDLLDSPSQSQLIATAFNRNHMINGEGGSILAENLAKNNFDRVETTGTTWLGLTVGCAQCHDHKFDPLKQADYYALLSFFNQISETGAASKKFTTQPDGQEFAENYWVDRPYIAVGSEEQSERIAAAHADVVAEVQKLEARREEYVAAARVWVQEMRDDPSLAPKRVPPSDGVARHINNADLSKPNSGGFRKLIEFYLRKNQPWKEYKDRIAKAQRVEADLQAQVPLVMVMADDKPRDTFVLERGNYESPGQPVSQTTPGFLPPLPARQDSKRANRLDLANWLVSDEHPLTARVTVNRYWQLMFGRGLVATPDDFGLQGALPTHPDLLDWLAVEFRESGWDLKALLKGIVLSRTYRQSAIVDETTFAADPENKWLARGGRQRLDSRLLRDQALALSGLLNDEQGGPPVAPYQPPGVWEPLSLNKNHYMQDAGDDLYRRSLYTVWRRVVAPTNFFDVPSRQVCSVTMSRTSTPLHALTLLNDTTYVEAARVWAASLAGIADETDRLSELFHAATARRPTEAELATLRDTLAKSRQRFDANPEQASELLATGESPIETSLDPAEHAAWTTVCLLVLNLDETLCK